MGKIKHAADVPLFLNEQGQRLLTLAVDTVRNECCLNGCKHCKSRRPDPLKCQHFVCGAWIIDCENFASKAVA